ncbi:MAG: hypothetical protein ACI9QD_000347 [Thermoproteota archaeon]|jgi:hypothetical protein
MQTSNNRNYIARLIIATGFFILLNMILRHYGMFREYYLYKVISGVIGIIIWFTPQLKSTVLSLNKKLKTLPGGEVSSIILFILCLHAIFIGFYL